MNSGGGPLNMKGAPLKRTRMKSRHHREEPGKKDATERWRTTLLGAVDSPLHGHHCVPKQTLKRIARSRGLHGPDYWAVVMDPRIGIALAADVHWNHEYGPPTSRIPYERLPQRVIDAAAEYGPEAVVALEREHPRKGGAQ